MMGSQDSTLSQHTGSFECASGHVRTLNHVCLSPTCVSNILLGSALLLSCSGYRQLHNMLSVQGKRSAQRSLLYSKVCVFYMPVTIQPTLQ
jgi:hypothetical protein